MAELLIARNPDPDSKLPYLMLLPLGQGLVFRVRDTWPRTSAVYCHPVSRDEWPTSPDIVIREALRSCERRGAAIDLVLQRSRENRSQLVFTKARGRDVVFWQGPRTRKKSRPRAAVPKGWADGGSLEVTVDSHERYAYRFSDRRVTTTKRSLPAGDYGLIVEDRLIAVVERKSASDFVSSLTSGRLAFAMGELAVVPRAAVVVEDRFSAIFALGFVRPSQIADSLAETQVRWPTVPIVFCDTRSMAEEYTYRFLAATRQVVADDEVLLSRLTPLAMPSRKPMSAPVAPDLDVSAAEVRAWAALAGVPVSAKGRISAKVLSAYRRANPTDSGADAPPLGD